VSARTMLVYQRWMSAVRRRIASSPLGCSCEELPERVTSAPDATGLLV